MPALALLLAALCVFGQADEPKVEAPLRVLFLGNSYTYYNTLPEMVAFLSNATPGRRIEAKSVTRGGANLRDLWDLTNALETLRQGTWDVVVLQDQSTLGDNYSDARWLVNEPAGMIRWSRNWHTEIQRKNAKTVLFLTWGRKAKPEFQTSLNFAYAESARELGALIAPAGLAWKRARETHPDIELFDPDGTHPGPAGTFLTACVFLETLTARSCEGLAKLPSNVRLTDTQQKALAESARYAVEQYNAGALNALPRPDFGTPKPLPPPGTSMPKDFSGLWKGTASIYNAQYEVDLAVEAGARVCQGTISLSNARLGLTFAYPLTACTIELSTLSFRIVDPRFVVEEFKAVLHDGKLLGTQALRTNDPYLRMNGGFELRKRP
jgi:hypothetical protein